MALQRIDNVGVPPRRLRELGSELTSRAFIHTGHLCVRLIVPLVYEHRTNGRMVCRNEVHVDFHNSISLADGSISIWSM